MGDSEPWPDLGITGNTHSIIRKALTRSQTRPRKVKAPKIYFSLGLVLVRTLQLQSSGFIESFDVEDVEDALKIQYLTRGSYGCREGKRRKGIALGFL